MTLASSKRLPGLTSMSWGYGWVRTKDGICLKHDRYLSVEWSCPDFSEIVETAERREFSPWLLRK
jgi:hypothetical protein